MSTVESAATLYPELFGPKGRYPAQRPQGFTFVDETKPAKKSAVRRFFDATLWSSSDYQSSLMRPGPILAFDERERRLLAALWALKDGADKLVVAKGQLEGQLQAAGDESVVKRLDREARRALDASDLILARSLAESALVQKRHRLWLKEQVARISEQLDLLRSRELSLKTRLALVHTHNEALKAQRTAAEARAAVGEALIDFPLEIEDGLDLNRLQEEAAEAEARAQAMEELVSSALASDDIEAVAQRQEIDAYLAQL